MKDSTPAVTHGSLGDSTSPVNLDSSSQPLSHKKSASGDISGSVMIGISHEAKIDPETKTIGRKQAFSQPSLPIAIASTVLPEWLNLLAIVSLIFGGCCSNVFALEAIIKEAPGSGTLITCFQFLVTAAFTLPSHVDFSRGVRHLWLKERAISFGTWAVYTTLFVTINLLNNRAFDYKIGVPLHIILRSAGPVATMSVQRLTGKRFEGRKVLAVLLLFLGVVLAAFADAQAKSTASVSFSSTSVPGRSSREFWTGFAILYLALMLSAVLGVFTDQTYAKYGRGHTEENLFYSHMLSLPFILFRWAELRSQTETLLLSPSSYNILFNSQDYQGRAGSLLAALFQKVPIQVVFLLLNGLTQYLCIRGVNQLAARSSSLTVGIVLNIRKLVSLLLSIWLFGNRLAPGVLVGVVLVFLGGGLYAVPSLKTVEGKKKEL